MENREHDYIEWLAGFDFRYTPEENQSGSAEGCATYEVDIISPSGHEIASLWQWEEGRPVTLVELLEAMLHMRDAGRHPRVIVPHELVLLSNKIAHGLGELEIGSEKCLAWLGDPHFVDGLVAAAKARRAQRR